MFFTKRYKNGMKRYIVRAILEPRLVDSSFIDVCGIFSLVLVLVYLRQRRSYMFLPVFVCLSVCLLARLLRNACMDLDEMLRVDRCPDMDELINF